MKPSQLKFVLVKIKIFLLILFPILFTSIVFAQQISGDIETYVNEIIDNLPGSSGDNYTPPSDNDLTIWSSSLNALLNSNLELARQHAGSVNYQVVEYEDSYLINIV